MDPINTAMIREHRSWLVVVRQLHQAGLDIEEDTALHAALVLWGENLALLRNAQDEKLVLKCVAEAEAQFNREIGFVPYHETEVM